METKFDAEAMTFAEAAKILECHNKWRRGEAAEPVNPTTLGIAIDLAVDVLECEQIMHDRCFGKESQK